MKHYLIYSNRHKDKNLETTRWIQAFLEDRGQKVSVVLDGDMEEQMDGVLSRGVDCMIVLGGDGTMLQAARALKTAHVPMIGVNLGTLGYMTEIEVPMLEASLERLLTEDYSTEKRLMLNGKVTFQEKCRNKETENEDISEEGWALNDIVISRSGSLQIIRFNIYVNGQFLNSYNADGMIVTTPTGSTGYNLSAGGPLVAPGADLILMTPICPHSLNQRSIVLSSEDVVEIEIPIGKEGMNQTVEANFDGSHVVTMASGDRIRVQKSERTMEFIQLNKVSFLDVLHKKMSE